MTSSYQRFQLGSKRFAVSEAQTPQDIIVIRLKQKRKRIPSGVTALLITGVGILLLMVLSAILGFGLFFFYYDVGGRIYPNVSVSGIQIGGLSRSEAELMLASNWESQSRFIITNGIQSSEISPSNLGILLDSDKTVLAALKAGRDNPLFPGSSIFAAALGSGSRIKPVVSVDEAAASLGIDARTEIHYTSKRRLLAL